MLFTSDSIYCIKCRQPFNKLGIEQTCSDCLKNYSPPPLIISWELPKSDPIIRGGHFSIFANDSKLKMRGFAIPIKTHEAIFDLNASPDWNATFILNDNIQAAFDEYPDIPRSNNNDLESFLVKLIGNDTKVTEIQFGTLSK